MIICFYTLLRNRCDNNTRLNKPNKLIESDIENTFSITQAIGFRHETITSANCFN